MMKDQLFLFETATGVMRGTPRVTSYSWTTGLNDTEGTLRFECDLASVTLAGTAPWRVSAALVAGNGTVLAAGPIYARSVSIGAGKVSITAGSLWSMLKRRVWQAPGHEVLAQTGTRWAVLAMDGTVTSYRKTFTHRLDAIATAVIKDACGDLPGVSSWTLATGNATRTYDGLEVKTVADIVADFFRLQNPPLMRFDANANMDAMTVSWSQPTVLGVEDEGTVWHFNTAMRGVDIAWNLDEDAGGAANAVYEVSQQPSREGGQTATQASLFARHARSLSQTAPREIRLETVDSSHDNVVIPETLVSYATSAATAVPYLSMSAKLARSDAASASRIDTDAILPGDVVEVSTSNSFFGDVVFRGMVCEVAGDAQTVSLSIERGAWLPQESAGAPWGAAPVQTGRRRLSDRVKQLEEMMRQAAVKLR